MHMTQHIPRLPWSDLASTAPSLPGGADAQLSTLREVMRAFAGEAPSGPVGDPESAERIQKQIAPLELTARGDHGIQLTDLGRQWLQDPNRDDLFRIMHARVAYFGEMLARINEAPARVEDLHAHATTEFLMSWTSLDQIRRRLAWLHSMGLVEDGPDRFHRITADGHSALAGIELQTPEGLRAVLSEAHADVTLPPAPPALATALERARSEKRSLSWSYLTKDPVGALTALARLASAGTTKEEAVSVVSAEYEISASSAKSFVDAAGALGIYEFVGKYEIRTTGPAEVFRLHAECHERFCTGLLESVGVRGVTRRRFQLGDELLYSGSVQRHRNTRVLISGGDHRDFRDREFSNQRSTEAGKDISGVADSSDSACAAQVAQDPGCAALAWRIR